MKKLSTVLNEIKLKSDYGVVEKDRTLISKTCKQRSGGNKVKYTECMITGLENLKRKYANKSRSRNISIGEKTSMQMAFRIVDMQINQYKEELRRLKSL